MRAALALVLVAACGGGDDPAPDAGAGDAAIDAPGAFTSCTGACATTTLTATFANTRTLGRAVYGITAEPPSLHVEAYAGGAPGCPTESSPPPDYSLILGRVPIPTTPEPVTSPGNVLDFKGDLLDGPLGSEATTVVLTPTAADAAQAAPAGFVALDVALTFPDGTVEGHLYATHCASLDAAN